MAEQHTDAVDSTAEEIPAEAGAHAPAPNPEHAPTRELAHRPSRDPLMPLDAGQVVDGMRAYQSLLRDLLDPSDWQGTGERSFPKKSAWRKIARAFNLSTQVVSRSVERDESGKVLRAETVIRVIAPNGQVGEADGYCSLDEFTGQRANDVKLENTLRATATTRAKNRAIADLVGMGEVSAEEVQDGGDAPDPAHKFGPPIQAERGKVVAALEYLLGPGPGAEKLLTTIGGQLGYVPGAVGLSLRLLARQVKEAQDARGAQDTAAEAPDPEPAAQTDDAPPEAEPDDAEVVPEEGACTCPDPDGGVFDDACPVEGHAIPF